MEILVAIDKILEIKAVRWALLVLAALLIVTSTFFWVKFKYVSISYKSAQADIITMKASIETQNKKIKEWQDEGARLAKKVEESNKLVAEAQNKLKARVKKVKEIPIREDCCGAIEDAKAAILGGVL